MGVVVGIDPGMQHMGVALVRGGRCVAEATLDATRTDALRSAAAATGRPLRTTRVLQDFGLGVAVAQQLADAARCFITTHADPDEIRGVAIETYVHQGPSRRGPHSWQGAVAAALAASAAPHGATVYWQDAAVVLRGWDLARVTLTKRGVAAWGGQAFSTEHATAAFLHALALEGQLDATDRAARRLTSRGAR